MIDQKNYEKIVEEGMLLDHYLILHLIDKKENIPKNKRTQGFINLLTKKEYIKDGELTDKGMLIVKSISQDVEDSDINEKINSSFVSWVIKVHNSCQNKLFSLTGGKQVRDKIDKKYYSFLPNQTDMTKLLHKVISMYKIKDRDKIEKTLISYIERCHSSRVWFPLLKYYIMKNGMSEMVTDMESDNSSDNNKTSNQKFL